MLIRNLHGDQSEYLSDFNRISFYPSFAPAGEAYKRECWESGKNKIINLINIMREETSLFGKLDQNLKGNGTGPEKGNGVFIVHCHDENAKVMSHVSLKAWA